MDFVFLHLECSAPDDVLRWANGILNEHSDRRALITTPSEDRIDAVTFASDTEELCSETELVPARASHSFHVDYQMQP